MKNSGIVFEHVSQVITMAPAATEGGRRPSVGSLGIVEDAAVAVDAAGVIAWIGPTSARPKEYAAWETRGAAGEVWLPELVECHTHLVHAGSRHRDFALRVGGKSYLEIAQAGGGIQSSVAWTREASAETLLASAKKDLAAFGRYGVGVVEAKSGYGLSLESELKLLDVARRLDGFEDMRVVATFLPAHAVPKEFKGRADEYVQAIHDEWLPEVARTRAATFFDVFIEEGFFSLAQGRRLAERAQSLGFGIKLHVDQFHALGGLELGIELGAVSCDHLDHSQPETLKKLAASDTVAVMLPGASLFTGTPFPDARRLIDAGARFALSTDFNPGTSPTHNLPLMATFACTQMRLSVPEALVGITYGAAAALGLSESAGVLAPGRAFRVCSAPLPAFEAIPYAYGEGRWERRRL